MLVHLLILPQGKDSSPGVNSLGVVARLFLGLCGQLLSVHVPKMTAMGSLRGKYTPRAAVV